MEFCVTVYQVLWLMEYVWFTEYIYVCMCLHITLKAMTKLHIATLVSLSILVYPSPPPLVTICDSFLFSPFFVFSMSYIPSSSKASTMYATMALFIPFPNSLPDTVIVRHDCRFAGRMPQHSLVPPYGQWSWNADVPGGHSWGAAAIYVADGDGGDVDAAVVAGLFGAVDDCGV